MAAYHLTTIWPLRCACCNAEWDQPSWEDLRLVGIMSDDVETIELRQCDCRSTCSVVLE